MGRMLGELMGGRVDGRTRCRQRTREAERRTWWAVCAEMRRVADGLIIRCSRIAEVSEARGEAIE